MKRLFVLAGVAAAAYGAFKIFRGGRHEEDQPVDYYPRELNEDA